MEWASANPLMVIIPIAVIGVCAVVERARYEQKMREYNRKCDEVDRMTERKMAEARRRR